MNTKLLALGLIATSMGFAADNGQMKTTTQNQSNGCRDCCCTPCCCNSPTPDKSICCECFVPSWYNMSCDCGFFLSVDFLYWYGRETNVAYAAKSLTGPLSTSTLGTTSYLFAPSSLEYTGSHWDPGVRVGLGWNSGCDGWDLSFYWTYYRNTKSSSSSVDNPATYVPGNGSYAFISEWTNPAASSTAIFDSVSGHWKFRMNNFDLELGRRYWLSKCFTMRPFAGLRGVWTDTDFSSSVSRGPHSYDFTPTTTVAEYSETDKFHNDTWGVGLLVGFQPTWFFSPCFSLYANSDVALVWGNHKVKKTETYAGTTVNGTVSTDTIEGSSKSSSSNYYMTPILDLSLGFRWENYYCGGQYHLAIDLGWEHHVMFHLNDRYTLNHVVDPAVSLSATETANGVLAFVETHHDVSFGGLVVRVRFDF